MFIFMYIMLSVFIYNTLLNIVHILGCGVLQPSNIKIYYIGKKSLWVKNEKEIKIIRLGFKKRSL